MNLKIFRCRYCGAKVAWRAVSCPVCNRLVSNDSSKRCMIVGVISAVALILFVLLQLI